MNYLSRISAICTVMLLSAAVAGQDHKLRLLLQDWPHPPKQAAMADVLP